MRTKDSSAFCSGQDVLVRRRASRTQAATENAHTATPTATFLHPRGMQPLSALRVAARVPKSRLPAPFERIRKAHTRHRYTFWLVQQSSSSLPSTLDRRRRTVVRNALDARRSKPLRAPCPPTPSPLGHARPEIPAPSQPRADLPSPPERHGPGGPAGLQNQCGRVAHGSVGSTPAPLRRAPACQRRLRASARAHSEPADVPLKSAQYRLRAVSTIAQLSRTSEATKRNRTSPR